MKINSINNYSCQPNYNTQPQFKARFTEAQLKEFCKPLNGFKKKENIHEYFPKLYTLLQRLDQIKPGALATYKHYKENVASEHEQYMTYTVAKDRIDIDNVKFLDMDSNPNNSKVNILECALVAKCYKFYTLYKDRAFMPQNVYNTKWWENLDKTEEDIIKDFSYVESSI